MREKEAQIRWQNFMQKLRIALAVLLAIFVVGGGFLAWKTSFISRTIAATSDKIYNATARAGYAVQTLYLEGRNRTPIDEINTALDIDKGAPILRLNLAEIRERLEKIESIKYAAIERALPSTLYVRVVEREPIARWQFHGKIALVDDNGVVMTGLDLAPYKELPLIVGEDAPKHTGDLMALLNAQPELSKRFVAAIWVGQRRWNIRLRHKKSDNADIEVLLPEKEAFSAWEKLAQMQKNEQVLDRDIKQIDLRIEGRLFIKVPEEEKTPKPVNPANNAKDT